VVDYRLQLVNRQNASDIVELNMPLANGIPTSISLQVADIRNPEKRNGSMSKTVSIPLTKESIKFFEFAFDANIELQTFNPNKVVDAYYYKKEIQQFEGRLQLNRIRLNQLTGEGSFETQIVGRELGFFSAINNKLLTDIDWGNLHPTSIHNVTAANVAGSWANAAGAGGYVYPFIDWGVNNSNMSYVKPHHLRACLFVWDYVKDIFNAAGYTWTSAFLDSTFFKRLIIPPTDLPLLSQTVINNNKFRADADGTQAAVSNTFVATSFPTLILNTTSYTTVQFQNEIYDAGGIFATPNLTPAITNTYTVNANIALNVIFKKNGVSQTGSNFTMGSGNLTVIISGGASGMAQIPFNNLNFGSSNSNNLSIPLTNYSLTASVNVKVEFRWEFSVFTTVAAGSGSDTWTIETKVLSGSNFSAEFASNMVYEGAAVNPNDLIPKNIKQVDFISSLIRMFNLYVQVDRTNPTNLIIEPREDFYSNSTFKDWTYKKDWKKERTVILLGDLDAIRFKYSYKEDGDYYNKLYQESYKQAYGYDEKIFDNDFVKGDKTIDVIFSPTPYAINPNIPAVIPQIFSKDNTTVSPCKPNIRILYWSGTISLPSSKWTLTNGGSSYATYTSFPHAGHTDNPYNPTLDINWGFPKKIYAPAGILPSTWTNNNLRNKYYSTYEKQISDPDSKIIIDHFVLTENDINEIDFRIPVFVDDTYYLINKVPDFDPSVEGSIPVELLKLTEFDPFVPVAVDLTGDNGNSDSANKVYNDNISNNNNNTNLGESFAVIGSEKTFIAHG